MAMLGFSKTIPFPILGAVVIVAGAFLQRLFGRTTEEHASLYRMKRVDTSRTKRQ